MTVSLDAPSKKLNRVVSTQAVEQHVFDAILVHKPSIAIHFDPIPCWASFNQKEICPGGTTKDFAGRIRRSEGRETHCGKRRIVIVVGYS